MAHQHALRPGEFVITDAAGQRFTTANDRGYAIWLSDGFGGLSTVTITVFGSTEQVHPPEPR